jgi:hypothetical protein
VIALSRALLRTRFFSSALICLFAEGACAIFNSYDFVYNYACPHVLRQKVAENSVSSMTFKLVKYFFLSLWK